VRVPALGRRRARRISAAARTVAQRTPETLTVARYRAQPTAVTIARLASTAVFAYLIALALPWGTPRPVLAPLTALLVVQVTLYQTVFSAVRRVAAVVTGVLVAIVLSAVIGFTWWSLGITIVAALALGYLLHLGETMARLGEENSSMRDEEDRSRLAGVLRELAAAVRAYGGFATAHDEVGRAGAEAELRRHLDAAQDQQDRLSVVLATDPAERPIGWPLRGELVSHIARIRNELEPGGAGQPRRDAVSSWRLPGHLGWRRPQLPVRSRR
jgi:hypothetical protein